MICIYVLWYRFMVSVICVLHCCHKVHDINQQGKALLMVHLNSVLVSGLRPSSTYKLIVYAENGVTLLSGKISADDIDVVTDVAGLSLFHTV